MTDARTELRKLAERCLVHITGPAVAGSGVWIAPGVLLTCAHVVPDGTGSPVTMTWDGQSLSGTVTEHTPNTSFDDVWTFPDLAIVTVTDPPAHPCAWLSDDEPSEGADVVALGHSDELDGVLRPSVKDGQVRGYHQVETGRLWLFKANEVRSGMSGGPVLDLATGAICAIVKSTMREDADRGGYLIPLRGLRDLDRLSRLRLVAATDRFHRQDLRWAAVRSRLTATTPHTLSPRETAKLFGLLAEFPAGDEPELRRLYADCASTGRPPEHPPGTLRDVALALLDSGGPGATDGVVPLLKLSHRLAGTGAAPHEAGLREWADDFATRHGRAAELIAIREAAPAHPAAGIVTVEIAPGLNDPDRYRLRITVTGGAGDRRVTYADDDPAHTLDEMRALVPVKLGVALSGVPDDSVIEFAVPYELFDEPFEDLPTDSFTDLGCTYRVVLRDLDRQIDPAVRDRWNLRWKHLDSGAGRTRWAGCVEDLTQKQFAAELRLAPEIAAVLLTRRPSAHPTLAGMTEVALRLGVPVLAWTRDPCAGHERGDCSGHRFREAFSGPAATALADVSLPALVQRLRLTSELRDAGPDADACRGVVLLWDRPPTPAAPLMSPAMTGRQ
ncbi:hypothetical protein GCM10010112_49110 [Actinoplanes lobatus]|uniref:Serine protease n=1 Tax=Actinoplanes lobatus TaxID=113568 RepID=A0A7W7HP39_9ACTN|nr:trypsin-like peptidase domain-containing protein [Actinoplanes lobatus]MBB4754070.1 hypothetical protein [Actinoplanes lobatus]GGN76695.1 hypothetical protein GCM10010112_49110 [Actinoplanes lobatus]GIE40874.1 hypothetical protein Alo02nite_37720 [Actinoplanes lobatus]